MMSESSAVPYDNREKEVLYAGLVAGISTLWLSLQVREMNTNPIDLLSDRSSLLIYTIFYLFGVP